MDAQNAFTSDLFDIDVLPPSLPWHNSLQAEDVSGDGLISPIDALKVINYLNSGEPSQVPPGAEAVHGLIDVNGDNLVTPIDVLLVVNYLNQNSGNGEGESSSLQPLNFTLLDGSPDKAKRELDELYALLAVERLRAI